jgi:glycopeptide antibiotics resistance protein
MLLSKKLYCVIIGLSIAALALFLSKTYRPYIYSHAINDFYLADTMGNIFAIPFALFFSSGICKKRIKIAWSIPVVVLVYILFEFMSLIGLHGIFDVHDIIATIISGIITYILLHCLSIKEL